VAEYGGIVNLEDTYVCLYWRRT